MPVYSMSGRKQFPLKLVLNARSCTISDSHFVFFRSFDDSLEMPAHDAQKFVVDFW